MVTRRILFLSVLLFSLGVLPVHANCFCAPEVRYATMGGGGQTCSQGSTNLQNDVVPSADRLCSILVVDSPGSCNIQNVQFGPCTPNPLTPGTVTINGSFNFHCVVCFTKPDPPPHQQ